MEQDGDELQEEIGDAQEYRQEEGQEEAYVVDADSTNGAVLVNDNGGNEEWGANHEGKPSA